MKITEIQHPSELNVLISLPFLRKRGLGKIQLSSTFNHTEKSNFENSLNRYYHACGCSTSAKLLLIGVAGGLLYSAIAVTFQDYGISNAVTTIIGAGIGGAILGKIVGLFLARRKLLKVVYTIQALWRPEAKQEKELILCG